MTEETKQAILDLDSVENMTSYKERQSPDSIFYQDKAMSSGCIRGIDTSYFETAGYVIKTGRNFVRLAGLHGVPQGADHRYECSESTV